MGMPKSGREYLSLVVKSTYSFPENHLEEPAYSEIQEDLVMADEYKGEPGFSTPIRETDFAFRKAKCDVIAHGAAHAPNGAPTERVRVGIKVGTMLKQFDVVGAHEWRLVGPSITSTQYHPFTRMEFSYDTAFGGPDQSDPENETPLVFHENPVGLGYASAGEWNNLIGRPLPNTEEVGKPVTSPFDTYRPMALGPIGRGWPLRRKYAGTYDQNWIDNVFPFLPNDFDERYFQMAPEDQQIERPTKGTEVVIVGMTPSGKEAFRLPETRLPIRIFRGRETVLSEDALPDTLYFSTENRSFSMTWRVHTPIRRDITEFAEAWVGRPTDAMLRARKEGRTYIRDVATASSEDWDE
ncbi:DUF2169 domain-containing protein [Rhodobacteraceae bacterium]|nr:DUF2169 domain-containing protein [Paracoccaceae bacterium]